MAYDDRYSSNDRSRQPARRPEERPRGERSQYERGQNEQGQYEQGQRGGGQQDEPGFFERVGEWFSGDDDRQSGERNRNQDRDPGSRGDYYQGGDRGQSRTGPAGGFEMREDYRSNDRYAEQGQAGRPAGDDHNRYDQNRNDQNRYDQGRYDQNRDQPRARSQDDRSGGSWGGSGGDGSTQQDSGSGYGGSRGDEASSAGGAGGVGPGFDPQFGGPRFDRADIGSVGTHGVHPVSSASGGMQSGGGAGGMAGGVGGGGGSSARSQAILDQHARTHGQGSQGGSQQERSQYGQSSSEQRSRSEHDPHYAEWRRRQIEDLDRDYDEYRRDNETRFHSEFGSFREKRGQQRTSLGRVGEHMEVVGSDGEHVGTVDKVKGDRIILTKNDPSAGGHHHSIPCSWIDKVEDKVTISKTAEQAMAAWRDEETSRALFEREDSGSDGPHILDRSFSGTYGKDR